jgi:hypothetical protein
MKKRPEQRIDFYEFGSARLEDILELEQPPFAEDPFHQLRYLEDYLRDHASPCRAVVIERHYVDRDYMEDHSVFYSRNLRDYTNSCRRLHFFSLNPRQVKRKLRGLIVSARSKGPDKYKELCERFSKQYYLGFAIIKPLNGCPVGRTVLKHYDDDAGRGFHREFQCTRDYSAHLAGVKLSVRGLAFQQQDIGVSACATTALWTALQKVRDFEDLGAATPAQITRLASQYTLPFGRSMPSEGLSIDQMCQAVQSLGVSPNLLRVTDYETARGYLYSSCKSGFAQVLILENPSSRDEAHAVTVAGMKVGSPITGLAGTILADRASAIDALYVHDDRTGPYLRADIVKRSARKLHLDIGYGFGVKRKSEDWALTHILIPMHGKIRLSFDELRLLATKYIAGMIEAIRIYATGRQIKETTLTFETLILKSNAYLERLFFGDTQLSARNLDQIRTMLSLSRYVGVIRFEASYFGSIEVLVDTTSTPRNINCLAIIATEVKSDYTKFLVGTLAEIYDCPYVT